MELIEYNDSIDKRFLIDRNIYIDDKSKIANGVKLGANICIMDSMISADVTIHANSTIHNCIVAEGVNIHSSCIEDSDIGALVSIGPYAHIRQGAKIGNNVRIGNFVEIKNSTIGTGCKVAHLAYVGDASMGENCNIGCGVVFCNYDGKTKHRTVLGDNVFVGSNVNLIAPLKIESGVYIAAGSTINKSIDVDEFAIARARQENKKNFKNPYKKH